MNFIDEGEFKLTEDIRSIERRICRFYLRVINDYYDSNPIEKKSSYRGKQICEKKNELLLVCIQDTCLGLRKFYASLIEYKEIAKYLSKKNSIRMYCVQGESLLSALGICLVIDEAVEKYRFTDKADIKQIQVVVTEKDQNWRSLCSYIVERVNSCYKNVEITLELISERSDRLSVEVFRTLTEVDIVVMARYLSQFHCLTVRTHFLEVILKRMKELSILFYLDTYHETYQDTLKRLFSKFDSLIEMRSKKAVYTPFEDPRNKKYFSEFPFLFTSAFEDVMYSTCVKYSSISYNSSAKKYIKDDKSLLGYSRREMKHMISERFETENSLPLSLKNTSETNTFQAKTLIKPRKPPRDTVGKSNRKTESARKRSTVSDYANNLSSTSLILSPCVCSKIRVSKHSNNGNALPLSTILRDKVSLSNESRGANKLENIREFKASKIVEKLIPFNLQNNDKFFTMEQGSNAKIIKTGKYSGKVVTANVQNNNKHLNVNKANTEIDKRRKRDDTLVTTNVQNKNEPSKVNKRNLGTIKRSKDDGKLITTDVQDNKHLKVNNPNTEIDKRSKGDDTLVTTNVQNKDKHSKENKPTAGIVKTRNACENTVNTNIHDNSQNSKVNKPKSETVKSIKFVEKLSSSNLQNKNEYKCPYLSTKESVTRYTYYLAEIYYSKYFDRKKPGIPKFKSIKHSKN